jgi:hypothetical protein
MIPKQLRIVALMRKKKLIKQAKEVEQLTTEQFNKLMQISWDKYHLGADCYKCLSDLKGV